MLRRDAPLCFQEKEEPAPGLAAPLGDPSIEEQQAVRR
jgi:hypothetical protein